MLNTPLDALTPAWAQRTDRPLKLPSVFINSCAALPGTTAEEQDAEAAPAPNIVSVEDDLAVPVQNACAVRMLLPVQPEQVPLFGAPEDFVGN
jgi:hypothetical protein